MRGKEWDISLRQTQNFCPENYFLGVVAVQMPTNARNGTFSQVWSHIMLKFISCQNFTFYNINIDVVVSNSKQDKTNS